MPIDRITTFQSHQNSVEAPKEEIAASRPDLPKDVLEALEEENLEKALFLLRQYQAEAEAMLFPDWPVFQPLNALYAMILHILQPKAKRVEQPLQAAKSKELPAFLQAVVLQMKAVVALLQRAKVLVEKFFEKALIAPTIKFATFTYQRVVLPTVQAVVRPAVAAARFVQKVAAPPIQYVEQKITEGFRFCTRQVEKLREKVGEVRESIKEHAKPIEEWLNTKVAALLEQSVVVKKALGTHIVTTQKMLQQVTQIAAFLCVPFRVALLKGKNKVQWLVKKLTNVANHFFRFAQKMHVQIQKMQRRVSKFFAPVRRVVLKVGYLLWKLLRFLLQKAVQLLQWLQSQRAKYSSRGKLL